MAYGWEGEKVRLVPLDKEKHLANALAWLNDPGVTEWTLVGDTPITRLAEEEFFDRALRGDVAEVTFAVETLAGEHVGFTGFHTIDRAHGVGSTGAIIGRKELWNQGLGTDIVAVRTRYAFEVLGLRLLLSEVMDGNTASERMLIRNGYRGVGRIPRRYFKRGCFRDAILFALERSDRVIAAGEGGTGVPAGDPG
jgi:RimJ/RimL family protein N-acetyltransferase